jgi:hypothetical protein
MQFPVSPVLPVFDVASGRDPAVHGRWLFVEYEWSTRFGPDLCTRFPGMIALDLSLRQLERDKLRGIGSPHQCDLRPVDDIMLSLSEIWMKQAYDMARAARASLLRRHLTVPHRVAELFAQLELVRPSLADRPQSGEPVPFWVRLAAGAAPTQEIELEHRLVPRAICDRSGSVMWWAVDPGSAMTVEIRRRSLSDAFLSSFD